MEEVILCEFYSPLGTISSRWGEQEEIDCLPQRSRVVTEGSMKAFTRLYLVGVPRLRLFEVSLHVSMVCRMKAFRKQQDHGDFALENSVKTLHVGRYIPIEEVVRLAEVLTRSLDYTRVSTESVPCCIQELGGDQLYNRLHEHDREPTA